MTIDVNERALSKLQGLLDKQKEHSAIDLNKGHSFAVVSPDICASTALFDSRVYIGSFCKRQVMIKICCELPFNIIDVT